MKYMVLNRERLEMSGILRIPKEREMKQELKRYLEIFGKADRIIAKRRIAKTVCKQKKNKKKVGFHTLNQEIFLVIL